MAAVRAPLVVGLSLLAALVLMPDKVLGKGGSGGSGGGSGTRTTTTTTTTTKTSTGKAYTSTTYESTSYGATYPVRITAVSAGVFILYSGHSYPSTRIVYDQSNTDDCALRNATAKALGGNDYDIDRAAVNRTLPQVLSQTSGRSILELNNSLYNRTGLIVDSNYCNYTRYQSSGGSSSAARAPVLLALAMAAVIAAWAALGGQARHI
ncbi:hypothetical protein HYH02_004481 [Chlamydomonas schloesseri]|uniref:Uncharacterized protein n=1 Tax=Chlamydomonas schloesseri TaxID=2026947 RepID=A0A835WND4_9CHLO|nr:hypothetical protein HYH02_004481 [Chlamydomonas schloesseri]|eukprot:KAG2450641.1 hypothetical protein HYH02_004481 [Chlamydomonas schloesseri]